MVKIKSVKNKKPIEAEEQEISFKEQFPSLQIPFLIYQGETIETIPTKYLMMCCLDKQKVKKAIENSFDFAYSQCDAIAFIEKELRLDE